MAIAKKPKRQNKRPNRAQRAPTFSVKSDGKTLLTTPFLHLAERVAEDFFADQRSVSIRDNAAGKTVAHFIYGHRQEKR